MISAWKNPQGLYVSKRIMRALIGGALALLLTGWMAPTSASAGTFRWKGANVGTWSDQANWTRTDAPGNGYPHVLGDIAVVPNTAGANILITIPMTEIISIASLQIIGPDAATLRGVTVAGPGLLIFDSPSGATTIDVSSPNGDPQTIAARIQLNQPIALRMARGFLTLSGGISENGGGRGVTKAGPGVVRFAGAANSYTGTTTVEEGRLVLTQDGVIGIAGSIVIGGVLPAPAVATLQQLSADSIGDEAKVDVGGGGTYDLERNQTLRDVVISADGKVVLHPDATPRSLTVGSLTMTGGAVTGSVPRTGEVLPTLVLNGNVTATSGGQSTTRLNETINVDLNGAERTFTVADGPEIADLQIEASIVGVGAPSGRALRKLGAGSLHFTGPRPNTYEGATSVDGGALNFVRSGVCVPGDLDIGRAGPAKVEVISREAIGDNSAVTVRPGGLFELSNSVETIGSLTVNGGTVRMDPNGTGELRVQGANASSGGALTMLGGTLDTGGPGSVVRVVSTTGRAPVAQAGSAGAQTPTIRGGGTLMLGVAAGVQTPPEIRVADGPAAIDLRIDTVIAGITAAGLRKTDTGTALFTANNVYTGPTMVERGTLLIAGAQPTSPIVVVTGNLGGTGTVGPITATSGTIAPGLSPGILHSGNVSLAEDATFAVELNGPTPGTGHDQLRVTGTVNLANAILTIASSGAAPPGSRFTIVENDGSDPIVGTFTNLPEGAPLQVGGAALHISYTGGDGNDVVIADDSPITYFLAEGATGTFFDDDVLIVNPNATDAAVTLTFLQEGGGTVVEHRTVAANARLTVHVDQIPGLEDTAASVQVTSDNRLPLVVERSMFWDATYYGGHTANAVAQPDTRWIFAEGFQGFFDTYLLIANANATATTAVVTFFRENDTPVVKSFPIAGFARKTIFAGDIPELAGHAFGMVVETTLPVIAERSMYFASLPGHLWSGGHVNTGVNEPSTSWFHAEGATGAFFNTFILLSNPQTTDAHVDLRFLLEDGTSIVKKKTVPAGQRLTVNPAAEGEPRLENAAVSTIVASDVPIVSERSMYWPGDAAPFGEGHNSSGVVSPGTRWGLAEGRVGGPHHFTTYILLANPTAGEAHVTVMYLRENGAPVQKTYVVPATSRFNIDAATVTELQDESFGARIEVTNNVDIAVERSLYWDANGIFFAGGSNALATRLP